MNEQHDYVMIKSMKLAGYLMLNGFRLISTAKNKDNNSWLVFWFNKSDELEQAIETYKTMY